MKLYNSDMLMYKVCTSLGNYPFFSFAVFLDMLTLICDRTEDTEGFSDYYHDYAVTTFAQEMRKEE